MVKTPAIAVLTKYDHRAFTSRFMRPGRPVVYQGYARRWPAVRTWSLELLSRRFGTRTIPVSLGRQTPKPTRLAPFLEQVANARPGANVAYLRNIFLSEHFPELLRDVRWPKLASPNWLRHQLLSPYFSRENAHRWFELFISAPFTSFPSAHVDRHHTHAWLLQVHGQKNVYIWPKNAADPSRGNAELRKGQDIARVFPRLHSAQYTLQPGDLLFIPSDTWHAAESASVSITLSGNWVNDTNWSEFPRKLVRERSR